jgi:hypothetical protein
MSLAIVAKVDRNGLTVVDSQTLLVRIPCGLITLNFESAQEMMVAAETMAFIAAMASNPLVVLVPETPTNHNNDEIIAIDDTPPHTPNPTEQRNNAVDSSGGSRDMLASSDEEDDDNDSGEGEDRFNEDKLAEGVHRVTINHNEGDDSFEDTVGLTQELW